MKTLLPILFALLVGLQLDAATVGGVVAWGDASLGKTAVPAGLTGVTAVAVGDLHTVALKSDGTVVAWGNNDFGQLNVPPGLANVIAISAGGYHTLALKSDGTVVAWGSSGWGESNVPAGLSGVTAIAAGFRYSLALKNDGTVVGWGFDLFGTYAPPANLGVVSKIALGKDRGLALKTDGTVVAWGINSEVPAGLNGVTAIAAGDFHSVVLKADGTIVTFGTSTSVPAGYGGVAAISAGGNQTVALKTDGTVIAWGDNTYGQTNVPAGLTGVISIAAGPTHTVAVGSLNLTITAQPQSQTVVVGSNASFSIGVSGASPSTFLWFKDGTILDAANQNVFSITNVVNSHAGTYQAVVTNNTGSVTSAPVTLTVVAAPTAPSISQQPQGLTVNQNNSATFNVTAAGTAPLTFIWRTNGVAIPGAANANSYSIASAQAANVADYTVVVTNVAGSVTSVVARLEVNLIPTITTPPVARTVVQSNSVMFSVVAGGTAPLTYLWFKDGTNLNAPSLTNYTIPVALTNDVGSYHVVVTNVAGSVTSAPVTLTVDSSPREAMVTTFAGSGGLDGSTDGAGLSARLSQPSGLVMNPAGVLFFADAGSKKFRQISPNGSVAFFSGSGIAGDFDGVATSARYRGFGGLVLRSDGYFYHADRSNHVIRSISSTGTSATPVGRGGLSGFVEGSGQTARFNHPTGIAKDSTGNLYVTDLGNHVIRKIAVTAFNSATASTIAGSGGSAGSADGTGTFAQFSSPEGIAIDAADNIYVTDSGNHTVRKLTFSGGTWTVSTIAGLAGLAGSVDGTGTSARFNTPTALAVDALGNLYLTERGNQLLRKITFSGGTATVSTVAGSAGAAGTTDGTGTAARFNNPSGLLVADSGLVFVADTGNHTIRKVYPPSPAGNVSITDEPDSQAVVLGNPVTFTVAATGTGLSFQWLKVGTAIENIAGATSASYTIPSAQNSHAGTYAVMVGNASGYLRSADATLTVNTPPSLTTPPVARTVVQSNSVMFSVVAGGTAPLTYLWFKDGTNLNAPSLTNYTIPIALTNDVGSYHVVVTNVAGSVTSAPVTLTVNVPPTISQQPQGLTVNQNTPATFNVTAAGTAPLTFIWRKNGVAIPGAANANSYSIASAQAVNVADYTVVVTNIAGSVTSVVARLEVNLIPTITTPPVARTVVQSNSVMFSVVAAGTAPLTYLWFKDGTNLNAPSLTNYTIPIALTNDVGSYHVVVTNVAGSVTSAPVTLTVNVPPTISQQPQGLTVNQNTPATFNVTAAGTAPLTFIWRTNGVAIPGAANANSYSIASAQGANVADYTVVVTNIAGSVTSVVARLEVNLIPTVGQPFAPLGPFGAVSTLAGNGSVGSVDGTSTEASLRNPRSVAVDEAGNVYVADTENHKIRKVTPTGVVSTLAGSGSAGSTDGNGTGASFSYPYGVAVDRAANVYVADFGNNKIRKVTPAGVVSTLAGSGSYGSADGNGAVARFARPSGVAVDGADTVYVADSDNHKIRQITASGVVSTLAGGGTAGSTDGPGTGASFYYPRSVAVDGAGNVYVADESNHKIRQITASGVVGTLAGSGSAGNRDGSGMDARFRSPSGVAVDGAGNVYVADADNHKIRMITPGAVVSTLAGNGTIGSADGTGTAARFNYPNGVAVDGAGNVYVADSSNHKVRLLNRPSFAVAGATPVSLSVMLGGTAPLAIQWLQDGRLLSGANGATLDLGVVQTNHAGTYQVVVTNMAGSVTSAPVTLTVNVPPTISQPPQGLTVNQNTPATFNVTAAGTAPLTFIWRTNGVAIPGAANANSYSIASAQAVNVADYTVVVTNVAGSVTSVVARLEVTLLPVINSTLYSPITTVSTLAGSGSLGSIDGTGTAATFAYPNRVAVDGAGNVYVADTSNHKIRKVTPAGVVSTLAGGGVSGSIDGLGTAARFTSPNAVAVDGAGNVYVADEGNRKIRTVSPEGMVRTWAGSGVSGSTDGTGTNASFSSPSGVAVDEVGNVYVADSGAHKIRRVSPTGVVSTLAGSGASGSTDGTGTIASFSSPSSVAVDGAGNVYVADSGNHKIRKVTPAGVVSTLAGSGVAGSTDGIGTAASFNAPRGLAVDVAGNVYVADASNHKIRKVTPTGVVSTMAGSGASGSTDGTAAAARFSSPSGVTLDRAGNLYVADTSNRKIRKVTMSDLSIDASPNTTELIAGVMPLSLNADVVGTALSYQWYLNGTAITGATSQNFAPGLARTNDAGVYQLVITNVLGSATSAPVSVIVYELPRFTALPQTQTGSIGGSVTFSAPATGTFPLAHQWFKDGVFIPSATGPSLTLPNLASADAGVYSVTVQNLVGSTNTSAALLMPPSIVTQPMSLLAKDRYPAALSAVPSGTAPFGHQWYLNGLPVSGATSNVLYSPAIRPFYAGTYQVVVTNLYGSVTSAPAQLTVVSQPGSTNYPAAYRSTISLGSAVAGPAPVAYQWFSNDVAVANATNAQLSLTNVQESFRARYELDVFNDDGFVTMTYDLKPTNVVRFLPDGYWPTQKITVTIRTGPAVGTAGYTLEENLPNARAPFMTVLKTNSSGVPIAYSTNSSTEGWQLGAISPAQGNYVANLNQIRWVFLDDAPRTLTYELLPPPGMSSNSVFTGIISVDGVTNTIPGATNVALYPWHPADVDAPADGRLTAKEVTAYASTWLLNQNWGIAPIVIPQNNVTYGATLWKAGEYYQYDTNRGTGVFSWVNVVPPGTGSLAPQSLPAASLASTTTEPRKAAALVPQAIPETALIRQIAGSYTAGSPLLVSLTVTPPAGTVAQAIEDTIPAGWSLNGSGGIVWVDTVTLDSGAGVYDPATRKVKWGIFSDASPRILTYELLAPVGATQPAILTGLAAFNGDAVTNSVAVPSAAQALVVTLNPVPQTVTAGQAATFTASVNGGLPITLLWQRSTDGGANWVNLSEAGGFAGVGTGTLQVGGTTVAQSGHQFRLTATNTSGGIVSSAATLTVNPTPISPIITKQPLSVIAVAGTNVSFNVTATGQPAPAYQWLRAGTNLIGEVGTSLVLNSVTHNHSGLYQVVVTNIAGSVTSTPALLTVTSSLFRPPARQDAASIQSSGFEFGLTLEIGRSFRVQGSTNFINWLDITNFTSTGMALQFVDSAATNQTRRFYRVISP